MDLTTHERMFLFSQKIRPEHVFDARGMTTVARKEAAKAEGKLFLLGNPCTKGGHRLKTRSGHCIECDTSKIAYMRRNSGSGYVYIAASKKAKLLKVGSCIDPQGREANLKLHRYGGVDDWQIIAWTKASAAGEVEFDIHKVLEDLVVEGEYVKEGRVQTARELLRGDLTTVWSAYRDRTQRIDSARKWRHAGIAEFDFEKKSS